jgi:hypothetical protein
MRALMASSQDDMKSMMELILSASRSDRRRKKKASSSKENSQGSSDDSEEVSPQKTPPKKPRKDNQAKKISTTSTQPTLPFTALPSKNPKNKTTTTDAQVPDTIYTVLDQREERFQDEPAIEELKRIWPTLRATPPVSGDTKGHTFGNALRTTSTYRTATSSKEVTKSLLAELSTHKGLYKTSYMLQRCTSKGASDSYGCDVRDLSPTLHEEILRIISDIEAQTHEMTKSKVVADHFLFHALMEKTNRPVAQIVTTSEE